MKTIQSAPRLIAALLLAPWTATVPVGGADAHHADHARDLHLDSNAKPFPAAKCLVSGEVLDSMGKPHIMIVDGQELRFCCSGCVKDFEKDKAGYLKKVAEAEAEAKPYPLSTCLVSGEPFDHGKPYTFTVQGQQVKLCCKDCLKEFRKNSADYLKKVQRAAKAK